MGKRCEENYCLNDAAPNRKICRKCESRRYRKANALVSSYNSKKSDAKRRDIPFTITPGEWKQWCEETGYLELRGQGALDMTVDRKDPMIGYTYSNIQMLTRVDNNKKQKEDAKKMWNKNFRWRKNKFIEPDIDVPF